MILHLYKYVRVLSLDVALGATIMSYYFSDLLQTTLSPIFYILMFTSVWLIYTIDHLMDAKKITHQAHTFRHLFHQKYFNTLIKVWYIIFIIGFSTSLIFLPEKVVLGGLILSVFVLIHFILIRFFSKDETKFIPKELIIAIVYAFGVSFGALSESNFQLNLSQYFLLTQLIICAYINLLEFSFFEHKSDLQDGHRSFATKKGSRLTRIHIYILLIVNFTFSIYNLSTGLYFYHQLLMSIMTLALGSIILFPTKFKTHEYYRVLGDLVFIFPVSLLCL